MINKIKDCTKCPLYKEMPFGPLTGIGVKSDVFILNDIPSKEDTEINQLLYDYRGLLLAKLLRAADIKKYYISSLLRCRPQPKPTKDSIEKCFDWVNEELKIIEPKVIITLGHLVAHTLLPKHIKKSDQPKDYVGNKYEWKDYTIIPIYNPHYLYMNGKREFELTVKHLKQAQEIIDGV